jgi:DNA-binding transcriptional ArsR family regulator
MPRSFRIDEDALEALEAEARRRRTSPSALLNQFLISYAEYGRFAEQMGALSLSRQTLTQILSATEDEALVKAAEQAGRSAIPAYVGAMRGPLTLQNIRGLMEVLSKHAHLFEFNEKHDDFGEHWTLIHELGLKWSVYLAHYFGEAFKLANSRVRPEISERTVIFWLD